MPPASSRSTFRQVGLPAMAIIAICIARPVLGQCPQTCIRFGTGAATACGTAAAGDSIAASGYSGYGTVHDATAGTIQLLLWISTSFAEANTATTAVTDQFRVLGVPDGTPLRFQAHVAARGNGAQYSDGQHHVAVGKAAIGLRDEQGNEGWQTFTTFERTGDVMLVIDAIAGEPFTLTLLANAELSVSSAGFQVEGEGTLSFADLPLGARVESCGGYFTDTPTPTRTTRWGTLKSRYRSTDR